MNARMVGCWRFFSALTLIGALSCVPRTPKGPGSLPIAPRHESDEETHQESSESGQIEQDAVPREYYVKLRLDPRHPYFEGEVRLVIEAHKRIEEFQLYAHSLLLHSVELKQAGRWQSLKWTQATQSDRLHLHFAKVLKPGRATLRLRYRGRINPTLSGLYHVREGGLDYLFTQMEPLSARWVFPCVDEPGHKTPWHLSLIIPEGTQALANTPQVRTRTLDKGLQAVDFATTPPLPSYLIAFAVGPLESRKGVLKSSSQRSQTLPFRAWSVQGRSAQLSHALKATPGILRRMEDYFGSAYPFKKLDLVAVPEFAMGAMENPGLVTFRDRFLLLGNQPSAAQVQSFTYVMAHELAHQWFGNAVTMAWWDDLWLNESFATWLGRRVTAQVLPEQDQALRALRARYWAMRMDSLPNAQPLQREVRTAGDIQAMFDVLTYEKGGALLGMLEHWLGEDVFREAIRSYINRHRPGHARTRDFVEVLAAHAPAHKEVRGVLRTFLQQPGVPYLDLSQPWSCDATTRTLRVPMRQSRYATAERGASKEGPWHLPLCLHYGAHGSHTTCALVNQPEQVVQFNVADCPDWVMPNAKGQGYYRMRLSDSGWAALAQHWPQLRDSEQVALADSLNAGLNAGHIKVARYLKWVPTLLGASSVYLADMPRPFLSFILNHGVSDAQRGEAQQWVQQRYRALLQDLGWQRGTFKSLGDASKRSWRGRVVGFLALVAKQPELRAALRSLGETWLKKGQVTVDHDLLGPALAVTLTEANEGTVAQAITRLKQSRDAVMRRRLLKALGHVREPALASKVMDLALSDTVFRHEATLIVSVQLAHPLTRDRAWAWLSGHLDVLASKLETSHAAELPWLTSRLCRNDDAAKVRARFAAKAAASSLLRRHLQAATAAIRDCAARIKRMRPPLNEWFQGRRLLTSAE